MHASDVFRALGGRRAGREWLCHCPVPGHGKGRGDSNPSLAVREGEKDVIVFCHAGCTSAAVLAAIRNHVSSNDPPSRPQVSRPLPTRHRTGDFAHRLWQAATDPRGTLADEYLSGRGLLLTADLAGRALRYHPAVPWTEESGAKVEHPALLAAFTSFQPGGADAVTGVLRVALSPDGSRIGRRMLGSIKGSAVALDPVGDSDTLAICEGLETGMSARLLGFGPTWVLGTVRHVASLPVLPGIRLLTILRETDDGGQSIAASLKCAERWLADGRQVRFVTPRFSGDMDDVRAALARIIRS